MPTQTPIRLQAPQRPRTRRAWAKSLGGDILALLIGLGVCYTFKVVGDIPLCELILIPSLVFLYAVNPDRLQLRKRRIGKILILMLLWLFGQIATDFYRSTGAHDWMRGDANIVFFILDLIALSILLKGNMRRQMILLFGFAMGGILSVKLQPGLYAGNEFKFGYAWPIMYLTSLSSCYFYKRGRYSIVGLLFMANIAVNVLSNFRSVTLSMFVTLALILPVIPERIGRLRILPAAKTQARVFVLMGITLVAGALAGEVMTGLAASGALGQAAQEKNRQQTMAGWGILIGGRPEILVSSRAVMDSPILGHGSWAKDPKYSEMLMQIQSEYGMNQSDEGQKFEGVIPSHSHLMNAWVNAGILGAVFWFYILVSTMKSLIRITILRPPVTPVYAFLMTAFVWDILFSPFGGNRRIYESLWLVIICDLLDPDSAVRKEAGRVFQRIPTLTIHRRNLGKVPIR